MQSERRLGSSFTVSLKALYNYFKSAVTEYILKIFNYV